MIEELKDIFPKLTEKKIYRLLLTIKARYKKYKVIGISRLEATNYWTSERQLQSFIDFLRDNWAIKKISMAKCKKNAFKCNVYSLWTWFIEWLEEVKDFVLKTFKYVNPITYVKARFTTKTVWSKLKFKVSWDRYIIHLRWKFKNVIYDVWNNCIINPLKLWELNT